MAQVKRHRTLVNPARKKARKRKRNMSAKQIKFFGTPAQKAALKTSRKRKTSARKHAKRTVNPVRTAKRTRRRSRKNPGEIITLALGNPARKGKNSMARKRKKSTSRRRRSRVARHRVSNPVAPLRRRRRHTSAKRRRASNGRRRRSNPGMGSAVGMVQKAGFLIAGAAGTRLITQAVLGSKNSGILGYAANAVAAFILGPIAGKVLKSKEAGAMVTLGGFVGLTLRLISDFTPFGSQLALSGMGDYQVSTFFTPARYVDAINSAVVDLPSSVQPRMVASPAMSGLGSVAQVGTYDMENSTY